MSSLQTPLFLKIRKEVNAKKQYNQLMYKGNLIRKMSENQGEEYEILQELDRIKNTKPPFQFSVEPRTWQQAMQQLDEKINELNMYLWSFEKSVTQRDTKLSRFITWHQAVKTYDNDLLELEKRIQNLLVKKGSFPNVPNVPNGNALEIRECGVQPFTWQQGYLRIREKIKNLEEKMKMVLPK